MNSVDDILARATLGRLAPGAAPACAALEAELFAGDDPWPESAFVAELSAPNNLYLGIISRSDAGERMLAYGGVTQLGPVDTPEYEIHTIGVDPAFRRRGLARKIMDALMGAVDSNPGAVFLEVRTDNEPAIEMYKAYGFEMMGLRKRYYPQTGADAYTMCRPAADSGTADTA
ncbi:ribosomal protein S18-alanine N-acetyltransferase [Corynebacterium sp. H113]|uniref:ribosomal protein S18-alanine N-acetyltransferase n=1 Tax=Corynebacterium sp. H113 TaxID=3133419 RepID=UPI0030A39310